MNESQNPRRRMLIAADHGGFGLKQALFPWIESLVAEQILSGVEDYGAFELNPDDDYTDFGVSVRDALAADSSAPDAEPTLLGILICRSGGGMAILANRKIGVRAVVCRSEADAVHARSHNNANVLILEGDHVSFDDAQSIIRTFLATPFSGGRHVRRVIAIDR